MGNAARILIAGGGIGGLATALALSRRGFACLVLERASHFAEIGAGIQIGPNAFHCFDALGVGDPARSVAVYIDRLRLMDGVSGAEICHIPLDDAFRRRFANPYAVVHRADLHKVLLDACIASPGIELRAATTLQRYEQDGTRVEAVTGEGERLAGQLLIAADGLNSVLRAQMLNDGPPVSPDTPPTARSSRPNGCRRTCAGTRRRCGPGRSVTSSTTRSRDGKSSTSS